jgi:hypothetical protein
MDPLTRRVLRVQSRALAQTALFTPEARCSSRMIVSANAFQPTPAEARRVVHGFVRDSSSRRPRVPVVAGRVRHRRERRTYRLDGAGSSPRLGDSGGHRWSRSVRHGLLLSLLRSPGRRSPQWSSHRLTTKGSASGSLRTSGRTEALRPRRRLLDRPSGANSYELSRARRRVTQSSSAPRKSAPWRSGVIREHSRRRSS